MKNSTHICRRSPWDLATWIWLLNRIAGVTIILYLCFHILVIGTTKIGVETFNQVMEALHSPMSLFLEFVLIMAVVAHGLNGLRQILIDFSVFTPKKHADLFKCAVAAGCVIFAVAVFALFKN